jgi:hypothetical protein
MTTPPTYSTTSKFNLSYFMLDILLCGSLLGVLNIPLHVTEKKEEKAPEKTA